MDGLLRELSASAAFAAVAGAVLWPPGGVYWAPVAAVVGEAVTVAAVATLALGLGAAFALRTGIRPSRFAAGGLAAYAVGMATIEAVVTPDSPVHLVWYAGLGACLVAGVGGAAALSARRGPA